MYADPKRIKDKKITLRFDEYELDLITAIAMYQGEQPSALLRQIVLREAADLLEKTGHDMLSPKSAQ